jgi:hypothetical protein
MYRWEVTIRTRDGERVAGTHTFVVRAPNSDQARSAALTLAAGDRARAHRRGARLCAQHAEVVWVGLGLTAAAFPLTGVRACWHAA